MIFFKNLWFFFWTDFSKLHKMQAEFYKLRAQIGVLELFKRKLIASKLEVIELKRINRQLETKSDREQAFEDKASIVTKLNRWANEVKIDTTTGRDIGLMYSSLEQVHSKIPKKDDKKLKPVNLRPKAEPIFGLGGSMK